ncbi:MAG TPA: hypothetical protein VI700_07760, partial [Thermoanaerobaculaceae bacterium]|nr:hypothetical protein [Thermoanaerobaculaceae bacterium]
MMRELKHLRPQGLPTGEHGRFTGRFQVPGEQYPGPPNVEAGHQAGIVVDALHHRWRPQYIALDRTKSEVLALRQREFP